MVRHGRLGTDSLLPHCTRVKHVELVRDRFGPRQGSFDACQPAKRHRHIPVTDGRHRVPLMGAVPQTRQRPQRQTACPTAATFLDFHLLGNLERVVELYAEVSNGAFKFAMSTQKCRSCTALRFSSAYKSKSPSSGASSMRRKRSDRGRSRQRLMCFRRDCSVIVAVLRFLIGLGLRQRRC